MALAHVLPHSLTVFSLKLMATLHQIRPWTMAQAKLWDECDMRSGGKYKRASSGHENVLKSTDALYSVVVWQLLLWAEVTFSCWGKKIQIYFSMCFKPFERRSNRREFLLTVLRGNKVLITIMWSAQDAVLKPCPQVTAVFLDGLSTKVSLFLCKCTAVPMYFSHLWYLGCYLRNN